MVTLLKAKVNTFVFCGAGMSRSPCIAAALMPASRMLAVGGTGARDAIRTKRHLTGALERRAIDPAEKQRLRKRCNAMNAIGDSMLLLALLSAQEKPTAKFPIGKDTTIVAGPIDKDGYINFAAALNERIGKGITPEKNANVLIWKALGPTPEGGSGMPAEYFKLLGIQEPPKDGNYHIPLRTFLRERVKLDSSEFPKIEEDLWHARQKPWGETNHPEIAYWLKANEAPLDLAIQATRRPEYFNPLVPPPRLDRPSGLLDCLLPSVHKCRELTNA